MSRGLFKQEDMDNSTGRNSNGAREEHEPRRRDRRDGVLSLLGPGITVDGDIRADGDIQVEGRVKGSLDVAGKVTIAPRGAVEGEVLADEIVIGGEVEGGVSAREVARLTSGCRVNADVTSPRVELEEGGQLNGRVRMEKPQSGSSSSGSATSGKRSGAVQSASPSAESKKQDGKEAKEEAEEAIAV